MLKIVNVSKKYKNNNVLKNINLEISKGEVVSIIGKSGCGKSTLLKCINKLESIDDGNIYFDNIDITEMNISDLRQKVGIVFQEYNLFEHLTVLQNLTIGLTKIKKYSDIYAKKEAMKILKKIALKKIALMAATLVFGTAVGATIGHADSVKSELKTRKSCLLVI